MLCINIQPVLPDVNDEHSLHCIDLWCPCRRTKVNQLYMYIILLYILGLLGRKDCDIVQILEMTVDVKILILGRCFQYKSKLYSKIKCFQYKTKKNLKIIQFQVIALFSKELIKKHVSQDLLFSFQDATRTFV